MHHLVESVRVCDTHKVLQGKQLSHLAGWVIAHSLQDELALADLDRQLVLCVLRKESLQSRVSHQHHMLPMVTNMVYIRKPTSAANAVSNVHSALLHITS